MGKRGNLPRAGATWWPPGACAVLFRTTRERPRREKHQLQRPHPRARCLLGVSSLQRLPERQARGPHRAAGSTRGDSRPRGENGGLWPAQGTPGHPRGQPPGGWKGPGRDLLFLLRSAPQFPGLPSVHSPASCEIWTEFVVHTPSSERNDLGNS